MKKDSTPKQKQVKLIKEVTKNSTRREFVALVNGKLAFTYKDIEAEK